MKTGKMKQRIYIIAFMAFTTLESNAQFTASMIALPVIKNGNTALDVNLKVHAAKNNGELSWQGIRQIKVRRYELEKSADGEKFTYVTAIAGNKSPNINYTAEDRNLLQDINYYRLKIIDNEGNYIYSKTVSFDTKSSLNEIKIMPGIVTDALNIWLPYNTQITKAEITDAMGREVMTNAAITHFTNIASLQLQKLPMGIYKINILTNTGLTANLKFSKK